MSAFASWELLRIVYNAALLLIVLLAGGVLAPRGAFDDRAFWVFLVKCAIGANLCYCLGPIGEGYLVLVGVRRGLARTILFLVGLIASGVLAIGLLPIWDWGAF
jgi:hypothetical protein